MLVYFFSKWALEGILRWILYQHGWNWCFLIMFSQTRSEQFRKYFNLRVLLKVLRAYILVFHFIGHQELLKSYYCSFFNVLRGTFWPKMCFRRDFEVNFCHCEWSCGFLMMFLQTSNGQIIKFFNLKGIRWENKILQTAQVGQNKHFWQKRNKNCW